MMEVVWYFRVSDLFIRVEFEEGYLYMEKEFFEIMYRVVLFVVEFIFDVVSVDGCFELGMIDVLVCGVDVKLYEVVKCKIEEVVKLKVNIIFGRDFFCNLVYIVGGVILIVNGRMCISGFVVWYKLIKVKGFFMVVYCDDQLFYSNYGYEVGGLQVMMLLIFQDVFFDGSYDV